MLSLNYIYTHHSLYTIRTYVHERQRKLNRLMASPVQNVFLFVLLTYSIASQAEGCFMKRWNIFVTNDMYSDIFVHVRSKDDDLGNHTIPTKANYNFSFCDNFFGKSVFHGDFRWGPRSQSLDLIDDDIRPICALSKGSDEHCYWSVRADGFYVSPYQDRGWVFKRFWN